MGLVAEKMMFLFFTQKLIFNPKHLKKSLNILKLFLILYMFFKAIFKMKKHPT